MPAAYFSLFKGEASLTDYQLGQQTIHHLLCKHCGVKPFGRGSTGRLGLAFAAAHMTYQRNSA